MTDACSTIAVLGANGLRVPNSESDRPAAAWALLSVIEGLVVMDAAGHLLALEKVTTEVLAT
jgi:hypothetical protein